MKIILASSSPNRKELLDRMGIAYEVEPPTFEEIIEPDVPAIDQVQEFALGKAKSVLYKILRLLPTSSGSAQDDILVIGFDSLIQCDGKAVGKAKTKKEAMEQIQFFLGKEQQIITGMAMVGRVNGQDVQAVDYESTPVVFRDDISNCQIRSYLEFGDWKGKCGSYSILGPGIFFLKNIDGDFQNIVGIPVIKMGEHDT